MEIKNTRLIVVLGMHRSGTSVITRGLQVMGVGLGDRLMPPIEGNNAKGFWEDLDLNALNIEMLNTLNSDWHHLVPIESRDVAALRKAGYFFRAEELLRTKMGSTPFFAFKDPRTAKLLPFWKELFSHCQFDVSYVMAVRHPLSVVKSLTKRDGIEAEKSYLLWLGHVITSLSDTTGENRVFVDYDRLMQSPDHELNRIAKYLDLEIAPTELQSYKSEFLDQGLRHTLYVLNDLLLDEACTPLVHEIYAVLLDLASDKLRIDDLAFQKKVEHWAWEFKRLKSPLAFADRLYTQKMVATQVVAVRDATIAGKDATIAERDATIVERDSHIYNLEMELIRQTVKRDLILSSVSWRITAPIRAFKYRYPRTTHQLRRVFRLMRLMTTPHIYSRLKEKIRTRSSDTVKTLEDKPNKNRDLALQQYQMALREFLAADEQLSLPSAMEPRLSVVIVLYNNAELTLACLKSLAAYLPPDSETLIIDNASSDTTSQLLDKVKGARIIRNTENLHFLRACNQARDLARGKYLLLLNNDAQLVAGTIDAAFSALKSRPKVGAVGARIINLNGRLQEAGSIVWHDGTCLGYGRGDDPNKPEYRFRRPVDYVSGTFLLTPMTIFRDFGGFDEAYVPAYYEETDYCLRLWKKGYQVLYEPDAVIHHFEFGSSNGKSASALLQRNRAILAKHHATYLKRQEVCDSSRIIFARSHAYGPRILYIDDRVTRPHYGAGMPRACEIVRILASLGNVTLFPISGADESWDEIYADIPKEVEVMRGMNVDTLDKFLRDRQGLYDLLWVSRPHNMEHVQRVARKMAFVLPPVVYDAEALYFLREQERAAIQQKEREDLYLLIREQEQAASLQKKMEENELSLLANARLIMAVSEIEAEHMRERGLENNILVLGHRLEPRPTTASFADRSDFLFVGALKDLNSPNSDSLLWFAREVWPQLRATLGTEIQLNVVGYSPDPNLLSGRLPEGINLIGSVPDSALESWYNRSRVFVIPTRFAAGVPLKAYQAAAHGLPMVTTQLIATQLSWADSHELLAAPVEGLAFANACVRLYQDEALWEKLRENTLRKLAVDSNLNTFTSTIKRALDMALT